MPTAAGLYYAHHNEGGQDDSPVILIHGAGSSHLCWPAEIRRMNGQRVLAVDLPGHGKSGGVAQQSIRAYTEQMMEFITALGLYQAVFVGHSMGGAIALDMAVQHPEHVAGLGLISTGAYLGIEKNFLEDLSNPLTVPAAVAAFTGRAFSPQANAALVEKSMNLMRETRPSVLFGDFNACANYDLRESAGRIEAPAWVIVGTEDKVTPVAYAHFLVDRIQAARLQMIPNTGHMAFLEQPGRVAQGLQQFLKALAAARFAAARVHLPTPSQAPVQAPKAPASIYQRRNQ